MSSAIECVQEARELFLAIGTVDFGFLSYDLANDQSIADLNDEYSEKMTFHSTNKWNTFNKFQVLVAATDIDRLVDVVFAIPEYAGLKDDFLKLVQLARYEVYSSETVIRNSKDFLEFVELFDRYLSYLEGLLEVPNPKRWPGFNA